MKFGLSRYTLDRFFDRVVEKYADRPALASVGEKPFTFAEFGERVARLRRDLAGHGVRKGDRVAILGAGCPNWGIAFMAVTTMGAVAVPVMEDFPEADIDHILGHSEASALFISGSFLQSLNLEGLARLETVYRLEDLTPVSLEGRGEGLWAELQKIPKKIMKSISRPAPSVSDGPGEEDLAEILYTSGTTGHSKGVMLTHANLVSNLFEGPDLLGVIDENSVALAFLPMAHAFGSTSAFLSLIYRGCSIHYLGKKPSPKVLMTAMQEVRPQIIGAVPLVFEKIYHKQVLPALREKKLLAWLARNRTGRKYVHRIVGRKILKALGGRLRCAIIGGAGLNPEVETFLREGGIPFSVGYGLSECSPLVTFSSIQGSRPGSAGHAIDGVSIRIADPDPRTGIGHIRVKGPNVMKGYYRDEAGTREAFSEDGWLKTGDLGYLDGDGYLYVTGRSKNVIVGPSGENIYPEVIEERIKESPFVEEALVYFADNGLVARVYPDYTYIQGSQGAGDESALAHKISRILEGIRAEVNRKLAPASRIRKIIEHTEPFLKTPTNKIKRAEYVPDYLTGS
jgi:long-chain acyl-CoA synthetase